MASYYTPTGHYSLDRPYFTGNYENPPLHALRQGAEGVEVDVCLVGDGQGGYTAMLRHDNETGGWSGSRLYAVLRNLGLERFFYAHEGFVARPTTPPWSAGCGCGGTRAIR